MMYRIVDPETEEDIAMIKFHTSWDAATYWKNRGGLWIEIEPQDPNDKKAFKHIITEEIVVVREYEDGGDLTC